jgi:hypothetical protein
MERSEEFELKIKVSVALSACHIQHLLTVQKQRITYLFFFLSGLGYNSASRDISSDFRPSEK